MTRQSCGCQSKEFIDQCIITKIIGTQGRIKFPVKVFVEKKKTLPPPTQRRRRQRKNKKPKSEIHARA